jgi:hypothetical protein
MSLRRQPVPPVPEDTARVAHAAFSGGNTSLALRDIHDYLAEHNTSPEPFVWTADADSILDRLKRVCERTSDSGH